MKKPEILAPAGTYEALTAAVSGGADGVYIGAKKFNARQRGENFDNDEIKKSLALCHIHGVKLYVALNIALKETEIKDALELAAFLYNEGIDGLIVQDLGLFRLLQDNLPALSIHSSTQMFVHEQSGVSLLCEEGFDRVVLARELTLEEIGGIKKDANCEIKIFCHGAMCISYSGQCYMSSMIGQRSGNRGRCAQPCRKEYALYDEKNIPIKKGRIISPKDLNTLDALEDIMTLGVDSLKIEGRLKNPDYVFTVVDAYRKRIDSLNENRISQETLSVNEVFNRKFTFGYLYKESPDEKELITSDNEGLEHVQAARIISKEGYLYKIKADLDMSVGDGIFIKSKNGSFGEVLSDLYDMRKNKSQRLSSGETGYIGLRKKAEALDLVYKTWDKAKKQALADMMEKAGERKQPVEIKGEFREGEKPRLSISFRDICIRVEGEEIVQTAKNAPLSRERIEEQLSKIKDTFFYPSSIQTVIDENIFMPVKSINELRRSAMDILMEKVLDSYKRPTVKIDFPCALKRHEKEEPISRQTLSIRVAHMNGLKAASLSSVDEIIYGWDKKIDIKEYEKAIDTAKNAGKEIVLAFPRILRKNQADIIRRDLNKIIDLAPDGILVSSYEGIGLFKESGLPIEADDTFNIFNSFALDQLKKWNVKNAYLSPELNLGELSGFTPPKGMDISLVVHGNKELMILQYDLVGDGKERSLVLEDSMGFRFPAVIDDFGRTHVFNSKRLFLADEISELGMMKKLRIDGILENPDEIHDLADAYSQAMNGKYSHGEYYGKYRSDLTKGHFKRGVL
ncbi:DUF3656 domain-containing U32 family peptidase [Alkalibacter saccharofermentans]|uniref:Putative protease n=1 Tax=Alkalibacter saccharofermentans DSM 14828 TaxID=1120975 RepID=A0A1M4S774_9FIRM|nr:U32 family peptidase [Alkalibacter saccharofermentans]SHE28025.1 putative protease [Alkalibacter saccharofermentans DSM 14828]